MQITLLGTAAGGGFPQWNCACRNCAGLRAGTLRATPRTQSSIFVQADAGGPGLLVNASPDILTQIQRQPVLWPKSGQRPEALVAGLRDTPIAGVLLCDGQVDHTTGLLMLRERGRPLPLWCTDPVAEDLSQGFPLFGVLGHYCGVQRHAIPLDGRSFAIDRLDGLRIRALALDSKAAPYSPHRDAPVPGDNIGLLFTDTRSQRSAFYAPGLGQISPAVADAAGSAQLVMVDGTFWTDDEMPALGISRKTAREIGHLPQMDAADGTPGMLRWLGTLPAASTRLLLHINNTNPILDEDSPQRATLAAHGVTVGEDGMQFSL
ncbi:pyrroloquinoline quinone biosynthesis protein PqqB [Aquabacterium sp. OR-4]|uniref:pyrroloquinoline quinone biosynthesis protein PqqB n=1 Tax=Aquabacterium sp. OR-4 TaxID=2978127 RepID=UPI0028C85882|nr:pyrroloquinoline quinone biosynthesis protein PqqB [Aquabacterium sp. OR-4]MDT7835286.1 pyrroloquinoline quinone biosynthesis protein PqqB [Aquabacterium sp. OR-4]